MAPGILPPREWHAGLAGVVVAAGALIRDDGGRVLCVKPNYRDHWTLPGGICELGEAPEDGCAREVAEEVGLDLPIGRLLVADWQASLEIYGPGARPTMYFIFDGGVLPGEPAIVLQQEELDAYQFAAPAILADLLAPPGLRRTLGALASLDTPGTRYLPHPPGDSPTPDERRSMTSSPATTMRAVRLSGPGPVDNLRLTTLPLPPERDGWVRVRVEAFGLNRSELKLRLGVSVGVSFPRVPGIEAAGTVDAAPAGSGLAPGQKVVAMMGDMGRTYDGGYAEYTSVPLSQVIPVDTDLPWDVLGALPEMVQTAYGALTVGLDLKPGQSLLIRGGTSSVGLAAAALATWRGATVLATTRRADRLALLTEHGVKYPLLDDGAVAPAVRELYPDGVDAALDLVGTPTLPDTLRSVRVHGTACFGGSLSNQWTVRDFSPNEYLPRGVRLAGYFGDAADLPREALQEILDAVAAGRLAFPVDRVYDGLEQVQQAHDDMEHNRATGKLVVRVRHSA
ncbi:MAG TPA: zinc-binding dehydrogenase [Streptosporangiaceae bacterium]|nr:zinc-binding dehydrogenase [Streptosporangiaceae bacterium]